MLDQPPIVTLALRLLLVLALSGACHALADTRAARVAQLLAEAQSALAENRLTTPASDNAFDRFTAVLMLAPGNPAAMRGLADIERRYQELLEHAKTQGDRGTYSDLLQAAKAAFPANRSWAALVAAPRPPVANADFRPLPPAPLAARAESVRSQLIDIAKEVQARDAAVLIRARNDAEGRWIYSAMKAAVPGYRVRGDIRIDKTPAIQFNPTLP